MCQAYCFWGSGSVFAPYYGAFFVSEFLGIGSPRLAMLDSGESEIAAYAVYDLSTAKTPSRVLLYNSAFFNGSGTRGNSSITLTGIPFSDVVFVKRLTAANASSLTGVTIGGAGIFDSSCQSTGAQNSEIVDVYGRKLVLSVADSEAVIIFL